MLSVHVHLQMFVIAKGEIHIRAYFVLYTRQSILYKSMGFVPMVGGEGAVQKRVFLVC